MSDLSNVEKAKAAWGDLPDWVMAMAQECDATTQAAVGRRLNYSGAVINQILKNTYGAKSYDAIENRVRGELMSAFVNCPATGEIRLSVCLDNQRHAGGNNRTSAYRARMVKACGECPRARKGG